MAGRTIVELPLVDSIDQNTDKICATFASLGLEEHSGLIRNGPEPSIFVPVTGLKSSEEVWQAFKDCFHDHYALHSRGHHIHDINVENIMYDTKHGRGVLDDWDVAHSKIAQTSLRTGTTPFMALDLLTPCGRAGNVERRYRHDCESFAWAMVWICGRYDNGREIATPPFQDWIKGRPEECSGAKAYFLYVDLGDFDPTPSFTAYWMVSLQLLFNVTPRGNLLFTTPEKSDEDVYEESVTILRQLV